MNQSRPLAALAIDLTRIHRRTITSFYSNLVTRPTGRAVRTGVEQQLAQFATMGGACLSILDFSQVRVMDYSCADEIVAKLLLHYLEVTAPLEVFFLARGVQEHHMESIEAVLERHRLLLAGEGPEGEPQLLGPATPLERACWDQLVEGGSMRFSPAHASSMLQQSEPSGALRRLMTHRVAMAVGEDLVCPLPYLVRMP